MSPRTAVNASLALIAVGLGVALLREAPPPESAPTVPVSAIDPGTVREAVLHAADGGVVTLVRRDGGWHVDLPPPYPADTTRVASLLAIAADRSTDGFRADGNVLGRFGLDPPRARLVLDGETFDFGDTEPVSRGRYVLHDGQVHLVADRYFQHLDARPAHFADPRLLVHGREPSRFVVAGEVFGREPAGWRRGGAAIGTPDDATAFVDRWVHARAVSVAPFDPSRPWSAGVEIGYADGTGPVTFSVMLREHDVLFGRADIGVEYRVVRRAAEGLLELPR